MDSNAHAPTSVAMKSSHVKEQQGTGPLDRKPTSLLAPPFSSSTSSSTPPPPESTPQPPLPTPPQTPSIRHTPAPVPINDANATSDNTTMSADHSEQQQQQQQIHPKPVPSHHRAESTSSSTDSSYRSRKEYMNSLVPPSPSEMARIAQIQVQREHEEKRRTRGREKEAVRRSLDASRSSLPVGESAHSLSNLFTRHKKSKSITGEHNHRPHTSTVTSAAIASATAASAGAIPDGDNVLQHRAATLIQRTYRGYRTRREMRGLELDADTRWTHAIKELRFREMTKPQAGGVLHAPVPVPGEDAGPDGLKAPEDEAARRSSSARYKWKKVAVIAGRAAGDMDDEPSGSDSDSSDSDSDSSASSPRRRKKREEAKARRRKHARIMGLQYFLEMVDLKHRYGSNLRTYHEEWKKADTREPFFYWLDYGEGKDIDMTACPRERLDREQVRYLSREERQYYLVQVDAEGRLCWAKNGARIDTTEKWKDSIHGIVPADDPTPAFKPKSDNPNQPKLFPSDTESSSSSSSPSSVASSPTRSSLQPPSESELEAARAAKYASPGFTDAKGYKKVTHLSASTIFNTLLRKSVRKNTWIFVADTSFRLYVGIKDSGAFQHSSFLQGSRISAAGLIKIKNGRLRSLSPLSGHYRPPASNFRSFVRSLKDEGVDMRQVSISKSYAVLVGLEMYMKTRAKGKELVGKIHQGKDMVMHPEEVQKRKEELRDKSQSAEKERKFLEKQAAEEEKKREENRAGVKVMQKLGISPVVPEGQKGDIAGESEESRVSKEAAAAADAGGVVAPAADESESKL